MTDPNIKHDEESGYYKITAISTHIAKPEFRAWVNGQMIPWEEMVQSPHFVDFFMLKYMTGTPKPVAILMDYTGRYDKNGTKVFRGDIIKFFDHSRSENNVETIGLVQFGEYGDNEGWADSVHCGFTVGGGSGRRTTLSDALDDEGKGEVIGNIYQNPELLK